VTRIHALFTLIFTTLFGLPAFAGCLTDEGIRNIDAQYEQALVDTSIEFLEQNLHADFVWVHNHASNTQRSRESLLKPLRQAKQSGRPSSSNKRRQTDVSVLIQGNTAIIYGLTDVERSNSFIERTGSARHIRYHFMRTYISDEGRCLLLANHTMEVWREGQPET
jgi:Domain of unknown function (DUF4440)